MLKRLIYVVALILLSAANANAWNCPSGQHWSEVAVGTPGATVVEGKPFKCFDNTPTTPPTTPVSTSSTSTSNANANADAKANSTSNANATAQGGKGGNASATQNQGQQQGQQQTANGGNANATGGKATATNGDQSNSQDVNITNATNIPRQVASAIAPETLPTSPCFKTYSGAGQGALFGFGLSGGKIDKGCDDRETARLFGVAGNRIAFAKIMCDTPAAKRAKLTFADCYASTPAPTVVVAPPVQQAPPTIIIVPTPQREERFIPQDPQPTPLGSVPVQHTELTIVPAGDCKINNGVVNNVCRRVLDDAVQRLISAPNAKLVVNGNQLSTIAVSKYLSGEKRGVWVDKSRVLLQINDEASTTVLFSIVS